MGGFKEMAIVFGFLACTKTLLCSALGSNLRARENTVILSSTYSPFPYKRKRSQIVVESVYPESKSDPPTTFKLYPTLIVTGSGMHQQIEELPQADKSTKAPPMGEKP